MKNQVTKSFKEIGHYVVVLFASLFMLVLLTGISSMTLHASQNDEKANTDTRKQTPETNYSIRIGNKYIVDNGVVSRTLQNGVSFNSKTHTLTLNNANISEIQINQNRNSEYKMTIELIGDNYITATKNSIDAGYHTELIITGSGTLYTNKGIWTKYITMESGNINIITDDTDSAYSLYGISTFSPSNENDAEEDVMTSSQPKYQFNGGSVRIIDKGHSDRVYSVGIDAQHGNMSIKNTTIEISLNGYHCFGLATGWTGSWEKQYGGELTIQNSTIDCNVPSYCWSAYCYHLSIAEDTKYYTGEASLTEVSAKDAFDYNDYRNRFDCQAPLLRIEAGNGNLVNPLTLLHVKYVLNGGENSYENQNIYYNEQVILDNPIRTGYTFLGWYTDSLFQNRITTIPKTAEGDYTLYAKWEKTKVIPVNSITLDKKSITLSKGKSATLKASILPTNATNKAVTWKSSDTKIATVSNGTIKAINGGTATITATSNGKSAQCRVTVPYSIKYVLNGGKNHTKNPKEYANKKITLRKPTKKRYLFKGWYTDKKLSKKITSISKTAKKDYTVYAKWQKVSVSTTKINSTKNSSSKKISVKYKKVSGALGYEIHCSTYQKSGTVSLILVTTKKTSYTFSKLKKGTTYYIKLRAYKKDSLNQKVYGKWSKVSKIKITK
jgi:uncharacterized repeat protein (TIGR02543 family)